MGLFDTTHNDIYGRPHTNERDAYLAQFSEAHGQYTNPTTGKVHTSERALEAARWDRDHRGW